MRSANWKDIAELTGIAAIVASLIFVGLQLKQSQDIALSELSASILASRVETNSSISDHSYVWAKGNAGADLDEGETASYWQLLHSVYWRHLIGWDNRLRFGEDFTADVIASEFAIFLHDNPGARQIWVSQVESITEKRRLLIPGTSLNEFDAVIIEKLAELDQLVD